MQHSQNLAGEELICAGKVNDCNLVGNICQTKTLPLKG